MVGFEVGGPITGRGRVGMQIFSDHDEPDPLNARDDDAVTAEWLAAAADLADLLDAADLEFEQHRQGLAGPVSMQFDVLASSGVALTGLAAVIRTWAHRHKFTTLRITLPDGHELQTQGVPLDETKILTLLEQLALDNSGSEDEDPGVDGDA